MSALRHIQARLAAVTAELAQAHAALGAGSAVELAPLAARVDMACAEATRLSPDEIAALRPTMLALVSDLDDLHRAIRAAWTRLGAEIADTDARRQAAAAYGRPQAR